MADPRSSFRFRMPRLRPSSVLLTRSTARKPPFQPEAPAAPTPPSSTVVAPAQPVLPSPPSSTAVAPAQPAPIQPAIPPPTQPAPAQPALPPPTQPAPTPVLPAPAPSSTVVAPAQPVLPPPPPASTSPAPLVIPPPPVSTPAAPAPRTPVVPPASTTNAHAPPVLLPPPPPQDEPRSMPQAPPPSPVVSSFTKPATPKSPEPTKTESSQPFSPSQTGIRSRVSSKPPSPSRMSTEAHVSSNPSPSPSTTSQLTSQPSSPAVSTAKLQRKEPVPDIASHNDQKDVDLALNEVQEGEIQTITETNEETFIEQPTTEAPKVKQKHQDAINTPTNIPNTPETKSIIPQPMDAESLQNPKPINKPEASTDVNKRDTSPRKQFFNEKPLSVITLVGDNRGTSMNINGAIKRESAIQIHRRYKVNPDEITDTMTDGEEISDGKKSEKDSDDREKNAYINCNIQGINNSMVFNSSFAERNPGVHLRSNLENANKAKWKKSKVMETDTNLPSEKITTIRRRCLRGLFMESSDSDADDPHKPRRHGCRYTGGEKMEVV